MRVSSTALADYCLETEHAMEKLGLAGAVSFTLDMARDLIDERAENARLQARITELEGRSGYCAECERLARRVEELEGQLAGDAK
jgi:BMFP domain-containing protein YqiC